MTFRDAPERDTPQQGHPEFYAFVESLYELHATKSGGYGRTADPFANFTAVAAVSGRHRFEYPIERMIEKLTRCQSLIAQRRFGELREEFRDVAGLAGCAEAMRVEDIDQSADVRGQKLVAEWVDDGERERARNYLRVDPRIADAERRWQEDGVGLTD